MATAYVQESHYLIRFNQSHLLKALIFLWTYVENEKHIRRFEPSRMDRAGIFDCAFTAGDCVLKKRLARVYSLIYAAFY